MKLSRKGLDFIKKHEGLRLKVYLCPAGKKTIGYGHALLPHERLDTITEAQAEQLLKKDVEVSECTVNKGVSVALNQNQFDALVSLAFNWGGGNFLRSRGRIKLNNGDYKGAAREFAEVTNKGLLLRRREEEQKLFFLRDDVA